MNRVVQRHNIKLSAIRYPLNPYTAAMRLPQNARLVGFMVPSLSFYDTIARALLLEHVLQI